jgi:hypothetical protein
MVDWVDFIKESDEDIERYFASPLGTMYGDKLAIRLQMTKLIIQMLTARVKELEAKVEELQWGT